MPQEKLSVWRLVLVGFKFIYPVIALRNLVSQYSHLFPRSFQFSQNLIHLSKKLVFCGKISNITFIAFRSWLSSFAIPYFCSKQAEIQMYVLDRRAFFWFCHASQVLFIRFAWNRGAKKGFQNFMWSSNQNTFKEIHGTPPKLCSQGSAMNDAVASPLTALCRCAAELVLKQGFKK